MTTKRQALISVSDKTGATELASALHRLGISILSYAGQVYFGMLSDRKLVKVPDEVVARFVPEPPAS